MPTFLFGTKGLGQKHSRLEHERVARAQYSLFFPIFASASSSTGRADVKIKRKSSQKRNAEKEISLVATSDQGSAFGNRKLPKKFDQNFPAALPITFIFIQVHCATFYERKWQKPLLKLTFSPDTCRARRGACRYR